MTSRTIPVAAGQTSPVFLVSAGERVTTTGTGKIQYTLSGIVDINNNLASWTDWPNGSTAGYDDAAVALYCRAVATTYMLVSVSDADTVIDGLVAKDGTYWAGQRVNSTLAAALSARGIGAYYARHSQFASAARAASIFAAPLVPTTTPNPTFGTNYYIDNLHANKNNGGAGTTPSAPWADVSNIVGRSIGGGSVIHLANDCVWDYPMTLAQFNNAGLGSFPYNSCDGIRGSDGNPVVIRSYSPRGGTSKPTIRYYASLQSSDWTAEPGVGTNIWSCPIASFFEGGINKGGLIVFAYFGTSRTPGTQPNQFVSNAKAGLNASGQYAIDTSKLYCYSVGNPNTYYGAVILTGREVFASQVQGLTNAIIQGIRFEYCWGVRYAPSLSTPVGGIEVRDCETYRGMLASFSPNSGFNGSDVVVGCYNNKCYETPTSAVYIAQTSNSRTVSWEFAGNEGYDCNYVGGYGGGLLYVQAAVGSRGVAWGNYALRCYNGGKNGSNGGTIDGCALYSDYGANGTQFVGNLAEQCGIGYQINNTYNAFVVSNIAIDCLVHTQVTHAEDVSCGGTQCLVAHNTWVWTGRINKNTIDVGTGIDRNAAAVYSSWNGNYSVLGQTASRYYCVNNAAIDAVGAFPTTKLVASYDTIGTTTTLVGGFAVLGFSGTLLIDKQLTGAPSDGTNDTGMIALRGNVADVATWVDNPTTGGCTPTATSPLIGAGMLLDQRFYDFTGNQFAYPPSIGAIEGNMLPTTLPITPTVVGNNTIRKFKKLVPINQANTDVAQFTGLPAKYRVVRMTVDDASATPVLGSLGLYTAASAGGTAIVTPATLTSLTSASKFVDMTLAVTNDYQTASTLYIRNAAANAALVTVSVMLEIIDLT